MYKRQGLDGGGSSGDLTISLDLSELTDMTESWTTAEDEFIVLDNGTEIRKLSSEIFGSNAFNSTTIGTTTNALTVDDTTIQLNSGTTFNGSAARTISAKTGAVTNSGTALATGDQIYDFVIGLGYVTSSTGMTFVLEDDSGDEVTIAHGKEVKFIGAGGLTIDWTDTDNGTDADPYDLTFTIGTLNQDTTGTAAGLSATCLLYTSPSPRDS